MHFTAAIFNLNDLNRLGVGRSDVPSQPSLVTTLAQGHLALVLTRFEQNARVTTGSGGPRHLTVLSEQSIVIRDSLWSA